MMVSVILPTYNRSHTLAAAMRSVLDQSYEKLELIVVDDGSSDDIESVVRSFDDQRLQFVRRIKNGGAAAARNTGLSRARGEYIAFQDSDDIWLPGKLKRQVEIFDDCPSNVGAVASAKIIYGRDSAFNFGPARIAYAPDPKGRLNLGEDQVEHMLTENRISLQNCLFRKDCMPNMTWFDTCAKANEDWEFAVRLAQNAKIYEDIEPVVLGYISNDSISSNHRKELIGMIRIIKNNKEFLNEHKKHKSRLLIKAGISLYRENKLRSALRFTSKGLFEYPKNILFLSSTLLRTSLRKIGIKVR